MEFRDDEQPLDLPEDLGIDLPLDLDPGRSALPELRLLDAELDGIRDQLAAAREMRETMDRQISNLSARIGAMEQPRIKIIPAPPACIETREGLAEFRAGIPSVKSLAYAGEWTKVRATARLWAAYWLCRWVPGLDVVGAWQLVQSR